MVAGLPLQPVERLADVAERSPRVRGTPRYLTGAEVLGRHAAVARSSVELVRRLLAAPRSRLQPRLTVA
jgi:hypothetical protein